MVEDQNFHKVKKIIYVLILLFVFNSKSYPQNFTLEKLVKLDSPWGSSFINDSEIIITEKSGKIKIVNIITKEIQEINHQLNFVVHGQGGLLDIIYKDNYVWISYTEDRGGYKTSTSIAMAELNKKQLNFQNIFQANPPIESGYHFGSRLVIKDNYIFASAGERGQGMIAQDASKHPGSIIRIHLDGSIPEDNPKFEGMQIGYQKFIK